MQQETPINISLLRAKIIEGINSIQQYTPITTARQPKACDSQIETVTMGMQAEAVLFIGDTGVGKSTLLSYLIGKKLKIEQVGLKPCLVSSSQNQKQPSTGNFRSPNEIKIGHDKYSETTIPVRIMYDGKQFYDCPGFNDNKSREQQIANSFYYQHLMSMYKKTKLVLVIDESYLTQCRSHRMPTLAKKLENAFGTFDNIKDSTLLIINKCEADCAQQDINKQFYKLLNTKELFTEGQLQYFQYLIKNRRMFVFRQPKRTQIGSSVGETQRNNLIHKINQTQPMGQIQIKNIISDAAKLAIRDYLDVIIAQSGTNLQKLIGNIRGIIFINSPNQQNQLNSNSSSSCSYVSKNSRSAAKQRKAPKMGIAQYYQIKEQIIKIFNYKDRMHQSNDFEPFISFCLSVQKLTQCQQISKFRWHLQIVQFFSQIYTKNKTQSYYLNTISLILTNLSVILQKIDTIIEDEKIEAERKKRKQQMKLEQLRLKQLEQDKQNMNVLTTPISSQYNKDKSQRMFASPSAQTMWQYSDIKRPSYSQTFTDVSNKSILPLETKTQEPIVLAFHRKLLNTELKIKQISYNMQDFHTKVSHFGENLDKLSKFNRQ